MSTDNIDEHKTNDDQGLEESLVPDLDTLTNRKNLGESDVTLEVCNPQFREEKFTKYVVYTVKGKDKEGDFEVVRRYKDFDKIRSVLVTRWPGCYIPPLPPKSVTKSNDSKFIEERRKQLQSFCKKVGDLSFLHYSEEYQIFLRSGNPDLEKTYAPMLKVSPEEIVLKYSTTFSSLSGKELNNEVVNRIHLFKVFLQKTQGYFENFKKVAKNVTLARRAFYEQFATFHNQVCTEYEKNVFSEYHNNTAGKNIFTCATNENIGENVDKIKLASTQPSLEYLYEWIKIESREIEAFLEAITQLETYEKAKAKAHDRQKSDTLELQKVLAGKTTFKGLFSRKSKEEEVQTLEKSIADAGKEIENYTMVHDMMTLILSYSEIIKFKGNKLDNYYYVVKLAAQNELNNVRNMIGYWQDIVKNENVYPQTQTQAQ